MQQALSQIAQEPISHALLYSGSIAQDLSSIEDVATFEELLSLSLEVAYQFSNVVNSIGNLFDEVSIFALTFVGNVAILSDIEG